MAHQLLRGIQADSRASIVDTTGIAAIVLARPKERLECRPQASFAGRLRLRQKWRNMGLRSKGSVAEWFKAAVLKTAVGGNSTVSSNLTASARYLYKSIT